MTASHSYRIDPDDPRAPPLDVWQQLSPSERSRIVAELPSEFPVSEAAPPEGDIHKAAARSAYDALRGYFKRRRRRIYIGGDLPIYYPGERMFSVDTFATLDVEDYPRNSWVVAQEGKGLDFALEIHWLGHRKKDFERNVAWFPKLGIAEYFVFDMRQLGLHGFCLPESGGAKYQPIVPQGGFYVSKVLGLDLRMEGTKLRFYAGSAALPDAEELIARLDSALLVAQAKAEEGARRAEEESQRAEEESRRAEEESQRVKEESQRANQAEQRLAAALAEIERLKSQP